MVNAETHVGSDLPCLSWFGGLRAVGKCFQSLTQNYVVQQKLLHLHKLYSARILWTSLLGMGDKLVASLNGGVGSEGRAQVPGA